jgi:vacuolar-type H+-ATPase subunit F/Vma7
LGKIRCEVKLENWKKREIKRKRQKLIDNEVVNILLITMDLLKMLMERRNLKKLEFKSAW